MEKSKKDYANGKIYKIEPICDHEESEVYYGSTTQSLSKRIGKHRESYKLWKKGKFHKITVYDLFDTYGVENCKIYLVEEFPCENKMQLEKREGEVIQANSCTNRIVVGRTIKEYIEDNKEKIAEKKKVYQQDNKEKIAEKKRKYYEDNKEILAQKKKQNYRENREKVAEKRAVPFICECGSTCRIADKARHFKSLKHQNYLKENTEEQLFFVQLFNYI